LFDEAVDIESCHNGNNEDIQESIPWERKNIELSLFPPSKIAHLVEITTDFSKRKALVELVETACKRSSNNKNGYAQVAWQAYALLGAFDRVLPWFHMDLSMGQLDGKWLLLFAEALSASDTSLHPLAKSFVDIAYEVNNSLSNGYARCAWMAGFYRTFCPKEVLWGFEQDSEAGRLTGQQRILYAVAISATGNLNHAQQMVREIYRHDASCSDGHTLVAWYHFVKTGDNLDTLQEGMKLDQMNNRLTAQSRLFRTAIQVNQDEIFQPVRETEEIYKHSPFVVAGFTLVGLWHYLKHGDALFVLDMMNRDLHLGRIDRVYFKYIHAAFLLLTGNLSMSDQLLGQAACSPSAPMFAYTWLQKIGYSPTLISTVLSSALKERFLQFIKKEPADPKYCAIGIYS
jgi:hypothetical protein